MILISGGAGYIASHTLISLHKSGYNFIVYDNLSNSSKESLRRVEQIINKSILFVHADIRDINSLDKIFNTYTIDSVIHFAGLKAVGESVSNPLEYYDNNVVGTLNLLKIMKKHDVKKLVFSSSATVYGIPKSLPLNEFSSRSTTNPYGTSKLVIEYILEDLVKSDKEWKIICLRYFNPIGADPSGLIGEDPNGIPNNLLPFISQVAVGKREKLSIFGGDYDTIDGTGVRDYIHVVDLAKGHVSALEYINKKDTGEFLAINLGTGKGYSVLQMVDSFSKVSGKDIPYEIIERRDGDIAECYADTSLAFELLGWKAELGLEQMCKDAWLWQKNNPNGYKGE